MRQYQEGDDLRRIHWPSVARTGELMIRQDESSRRANALVFLDSREGMLGQAHGQAFERAVSVAATLGVLLSRGGFSLRLATADTPPAALSRGAVPRGPHRGRALAGPLRRPRALAPARVGVRRHDARRRRRAPAARASSPP